MPHYADGTEAKLGDRVRGTGYNAEHKGYDAATGIEGIVTDVREGDNRAGGCTLSVAFLRLSPPNYHGLSITTGADAPPVHIETEYGDTVGFNKV